MAPTTDAIKSSPTQRGKSGRPSKARRAGWERFLEFIETGAPGANSYVVLLGLETFDWPQLRRSVQHGLPYSAFDQLLANTSLPSDEALALVNIPQRTLTRRKREGRFHQDESDRLLRASRVFARTLVLFEGDRDGAKHWLSTPKKALGGEVPLELARTEVGALEVERLIGRLEHGVFT
jgi:putative toxin-antitoxin system antitoxin component (TIGR02293 family)